MANRYGCIIIGAGMSGLAAGIRLAMFDKPVCILEQHSIPGGLNSYYKRKSHLLDVGLHAMTNFAEKGQRGKPLTKLLKQLRIPYEKLQLNEQTHSKVVFPKHSLKFTNNIETLLNEIEENFPSQLPGLQKLLELIENFNETALDNEHFLAKPKVAEFISDPTLLEMIFCPLLIYGSAWENDMDFSQFAIMFKSIFLEGFSRPSGGVRTVIDLLLERYNSLGGELRFKSKVKSINKENGKATSVTLQNGEELYADCILSSAGLPETFKLTEGNKTPAVGKLSFTETILILNKEVENKDTIIFFNDRDSYHYQRPETLIDSKSAVLCFPGNFKEQGENNIIRITNIANYDLWKNLTKDQYKLEKEKVLQTALEIANRFTPVSAEDVTFKDIFTPLTVEKFTGHFGGTVYGSTEKSRDGKTDIDGLYVCGTDQGFLGIVGSMLSGISMANLHGLMK